MLCRTYPKYHGDNQYLSLSPDETTIFFSSNDGNGWGGVGRWAIGATTFMYWQSSGRVNYAMRSLLALNNDNYIISHQTVSFFRYTRGTMGTVAANWSSLLWFSDWGAHYGVSVFSDDRSKLHYLQIIGSPVRYALVGTLNVTDGTLIGSIYQSSTIWTIGMVY